MYNLIHLSQVQFEALQHKHYFSCCGLNGTGQLKGGGKKKNNILHIFMCPEEKVV